MVRTVRFTLMMLAGAKKFATLVEPLTSVKSSLTAYSQPLGSASSAVAVGVMNG